MDLIGIPLRITVGKGIQNNEVEFKRRTEKDSTNIKIDDIVKHVTDIVKKESK